MALAPQLLGVGQITAKVSAPGKDVFATDYVPPLRGKRSTVLPYETMHPQPKPVPQRPPTKQCPAHNMGACPTCLACKRGVRNCCALGHHRPGYTKRRASLQRCLKHDMPPYPTCQRNTQGMLFCCAAGHHEGRRKPGPPTEGFGARALDAG